MEGRSLAGSAGPWCVPPGSVSRGAAASGCFLFAECGKKNTLALSCPCLPESPRGLWLL